MKRYDRKLTFMHGYATHVAHITKLASNYSSESTVAMSGQRWSVVGVSSDQSKLSNLEKSHHEKMICTLIFKL